VNGKTRDVLLHLLNVPDTEKFIAPVCRFLNVGKSHIIKSKSVVSGGQKASFASTIKKRKSELSEAIKKGEIVYFCLGQHWPASIRHPLRPKQAVFIHLIEFSVIVPPGQIKPSNHLIWLQYKD
jgi:hypothetical protein